MPFYFSLKGEPPEVRRRAVEGLTRLRAQFTAQQVPARTVDGTLLLATWNIREFDNAKYGWRTTEALYFIAEIISRFDLIALQEINENLWALDEVQRILGGWWKYLVTDTTEGAPGNRERMAFMYDSRKVAFGGLAGEIVLPKPKDGEVLQFARTPFICGFKAGWSKFNLCTVHIYYGEDKADNPQRIREIHDVAKFLADRVTQPARPEGAVTKMRNTDEEDVVLLGDFNIYSRSDATMKAITDAGFVTPEALQTIPGSNVAHDKFYDQIAFKVRPDRFGTTGKAGVFDYYKSVFRAEDEADFAPLIGKPYADAANKPRYFKEWRTYQMSDHLPMWIELRTDYSDAYLATLAQPVAPTPPPPV